MTSIAGRWHRRKPRSSQHAYEYINYLHSATTQYRTFKALACVYKRRADPYYIVCRMNSGIDFKWRCASRTRALVLGRIVVTNNGGR